MVLPPHLSQHIFRRYMLYYKLYHPKMCWDKMDKITALKSRSFSAAMLETSVDVPHGRYHLPKK